MNDFIRLTSITGNQLAIDVFEIVSLLESDNGTLVSLRDENVFHVKETIDDIFAVWGSREV